jgi:zinc protease
MAAQANKATLDEVKAFHAARYGPRGLRIVVTGDVQPEAVRKHVSKLLAGWKTQPHTAPQPKPAAQAAATIKVPMPDKASVTVLYGQPIKVKAGDPGWLALQLANDALGSGFTSRLIGNIRDREGLTYGVGSRIFDDAMRPGLWSVRSSFAPSMLERGVAAIRREVGQWHEEGITADELEFRKSAMGGEFAVGLETTRGLAEQILLCVRRGFDLKWLDEYPAMLEKLTLEEVNRAIRAQLDPQKMVLVEAGVAEGQ